MTTVPTSDWIRQYSRVPFDELGWGPAQSDEDPPTVDLLAEEMLAVVVWLEDTIGYAFETVDPSQPLMTVIPDRRAGEMRKALRMLLEYEAYKQSPDYVEGTIDFDVIDSFSAGSYSEQRRDERFLRFQKDEELHPVPAIDAILSSLQADWKKKTHEAMAIGHSDPSRMAGTEIMNARYSRGCYNPYDFNNWAVTDYPVPGGIGGGLLGSGGWDIG